ncbi:hypothetical protein GCM10025738_24040 [Microbacterium fluvii]
MQGIATQEPQTLLLVAVLLMTATALVLTIVQYVKRYGRNRDE